MANLVNGALTGVSKVAGEISSVANKLANTTSGAVKTRKALPNSIYLADLFRWKLFSRVDFDSVLKYLYDKGIVRTTNLYTVKTLANELLPRVSYEALSRRSPKKALGLFALVGKLCIRKKKGLLCYIDLEAGVAKKIYKFDDFITYAQFPENIQPADLWISPDIAFPKLKHRCALKTAAKYEVVSANTKEVDVVGAESQKPEKQYLKVLPRLAMPQKTQKGQTSIFDNDEVNFVELFLSRYQVAQSEAGGDNKFDSLLFPMLAQLVDTEPTQDINQFVAEVANLFSTLGVRNFVDSLQRTKGAVMESFRMLYQLDEGNDDASTEEFIQVVHALWERLTGLPVSQEPARDFVTLRKRLFEVLRAKAEKAAKEAEEKQLQQKEEAKQAQEAAESQEVQDKLSELSQSMRSAYKPEDIVL